MILFILIVFSSSTANDVAYMISDKLCSPCAINCYCYCKNETNDITFR